METNESAVRVMPPSVIVLPRRAAPTSLSNRINSSITASSILVIGSRSHSHCSAVAGSCLAIRRQHRWVGHTVRVASRHRLLS
jgi:hypothetical protein